MTADNTRTGPTRQAKHSNGPSKEKKEKKQLRTKTGIHYVVNFWLLCCFGTKLLETFWCNFGVTFNKGPPFFKRYNVV